MTAPRAVDPGRLLRALRLDVERLGPGRFRVTGGAAPHLVEVREGQAPTCDCVDTQLHPATVCKHRLAVRLWLRLDRPILLALREVVGVGQ